MLNGVLSRHLSPTMKVALIDERLGVIAQAAYREHLVYLGFVTSDDTQRAAQSQKAIIEMTNIADALDALRQTIVNADVEEVPHGHDHQ